MRRTNKPIKKKPLRSHLQAVFLKRVREEMEAQGLTSINQLAAREGAPPQTTLNDILSMQSDPRLSQVQKIAVALGQTTAVSLLTESIAVAVPRGKNVHQMPDPYPSIFGKPQDAKDKQPAKARKQR